MQDSSFRKTRVLSKETGIISAITIQSQLSLYQRLEGWEGWANRNQTNKPVSTDIECFKSYGKNKTSIVMSNIDASSTL